MKDKKAIIVFLIITFALSSLCYYLVITGGEKARGIIGLLMWCPAIGAFLVQQIFYRREQVLGFHQCSIIYFILGFVIPIIYLGVSYGGLWIVDSKTFIGLFDSTSIPLLLATLLSAFALALGEEIGWRGYLLPKLSKLYGVGAAIVISGLIWAIWHYPLMVTGLYKPGTPMWYQLSLFTIEILLISGILAMLRLKSKSVWPAAIFHASHNFFDQAIFEPITGGDSSVYYVGETGIITAVIMAIIFYIMYRKYKPFYKLMRDY